MAAASPAAERISSPSAATSAMWRRRGRYPRHLRVADNIGFGLARSQRRGRHRIGELLELVGLPAAFADRLAASSFPAASSSASRSARALAPEPKLILLDEPFSALDTALRVETREAVAAALTAAGQTAILVTHDQPEALSMADPVAVLRDGRLIQIADPRTLYRHPVDTELARFVGEAILLPGQAAGGFVDCELGRLPVAGPRVEGAVDVLIRPEQVQLHATATAGTLPARVESVRYYGRDASARLLLLGAKQSCIVTALVPGHRAPAAGERVWIEVDGRVAAYPTRGNAQGFVTADQPGAEAAVEPLRAKA